MSLPSIPLSVLDLAIVSHQSTSRQALLDTTETAQAADRLGYHRFWVAEHHNMSTVASTSPSTLMAHLAGATQRIRVGSGGVMLPNHAPLVVAEQFALLEALHPNRIDLGIGRAPGTDRATAVALRGNAHNRDAENFPHHLIEVMGLLGDARRDQGVWQQLSASPTVDSAPAVFLLGSSDFSAQLAAILGLPFVFAHHFDMGGTLDAVSIYRERFEPSERLDQPQVIVTASVLASTDRDAAERLAAPTRLRRLGLRTGQLLPLLSPDDAMAHPSYEMAAAMASNMILGDGDEVVDALGGLAASTGADELMLFTSTHDLADRLTSFELVAAGWGLS